MSITTKVVGSYKIIEVKEETNGSIHRRTISPSDDTSSESPEIKQYYTFSKSFVKTQNHYWLHFFCSISALTFSKNILLGV